MAGVGATTRERIVETAVRLDFSASPLATALARGESRTIGVVLPTLRSWYFSEVAAGASEILSPAGFHVELINVDIDSDFLDADSALFQELMRELGAGRGRDAMLFAGTISVEPDAGHPESATVPILADGSPLTSVPGVFIDHRAGGRMIAEHLLALGHTFVGVIDGRMPDKPDTHVWDQRTAGFRDAMAAAGVMVDADSVMLPGDCHAADGERAMEDFLARGRPLPTALFCHTDELAFGAIAALRRRDIHCPEDISIAGFDDHPMSRYWGLTTVSQHAHEQGVRAAHALIAALRNDPGVEPGGSQNGTDWQPYGPDVRVELMVRETTRTR